MDDIERAHVFSLNPQLKTHESSLHHSTDNLMHSVYILLLTVTHAIYIFLLTISCEGFYLSIDNMTRVAYIILLTIPFVQFISHYL